MAVASRNQTVDLIRVIAAYGVVVIHVANSTPGAEKLGLFFSIYCVPFFYVAALTYFIVGLKAPYELSSILTRLWSRIVVPYLAWTAIYFLLLFIKKRMVNQPMNFEYWKIIFYGNSAAQLYFLPELLMMQLLITSFFLLTSITAKKVFQAIGLLAIAISFFLIGYAGNCFGAIPPTSILTFTLGAFVVASILKSGSGNKICLLGGLVLCCFSIVTTFVKLPFAYPPVLQFLPISGVGLLLIAISAYIKQMPKLLVTLAGLSFGIYLSHVVFLEMFEMAVSKIWKAGITYNFGVKAGVALLLFTLAALFCMVINRFVLLRKVLLGKSE